MRFDVPTNAIQGNLVLQLEPELHVPVALVDDIRSVVPPNSAPQQAAGRLKVVERAQLRKIDVTSNPHERRVLLNGLLFVEELFTSLIDDQGAALELGQRISTLAQEMDYSLGEGLNHLLVSNAALRSSAFDHFQEAGARLVLLAERLRDAPGQEKNRALIEIFEHLVTNCRLKLESRYATALVVAKQAEAKYRELQKSVPGLLHQILCAQATDLYYLHDFDSAWRLFSELRELQDDLASVEDYFGRIQFYKAEYQSALSVFESALARAKHGGDRFSYNFRRQSRLWEGKGRTLIEMGDFEGAEEAIDRSVALAQEVDAVFEIACATIYKARIQSQRREFGKALFSLKKARSDFGGKDGNTELKCTRQLFRLALLESGVRLRQGEFLLAEKAAEEAARYLPERPKDLFAGYPVEEALLARQLSLIATVRGDISASRRHFDRALSYLESIGRDCSNLYLARTLTEAAYSEILWAPGSLQIDVFIEKAKWIARSTNHKRELVRALVVEILSWCAAGGSVDLTRSELFRAHSAELILESIEVTYGQKPARVIAHFVRSLLDSSPRPQFALTLVKRFSDALEGLVQDSDTDERMRALARPILEQVAEVARPPEVASEVQKFNEMFDRAESANSSANALVECLNQHDLTHFETALVPARETFGRLASEIIALSADRPHDGDSRASDTN